MKNNIQYKRQTREMPEETKQKISASLRGRAKSYTHKQNISNGVKTYWEQIPKKQNDGQTTINDIM